MAEGSGAELRQRARDLGEIPALIGQDFRSGLPSNRPPPAPVGTPSHLVRKLATSALAFMARFPPMDGTVKKMSDRYWGRSILPAVTLAIHQRP